MFKFDYDDGCNEHKDSLPMVRRFQYIDMVKGLATFNGVRVLFGATLSSALVSTIMGALYFIPLILLFLFGAKLLTRMILSLVYKVVPRTKENRWTLNSIAMSFWTLPLALALPGAAYFAMILFLLIPYGVVSILFFGKSADEAFLLHNVIANINLDTFSFGEIFKRIFWYDAEFPIISYIKIAGCFFAPYLFYYGHQDVTKHEFLTSSGDCELIFE